MDQPDEKTPVVNRWWWVRSLLSAALFFVAGVGIIAILGLAQRAGWITSTSGPVSVADGDDSKIYTCPMHPQIRQPTPGRCPICGMKLTLPIKKSEKEDPLAVNIDVVARRVADIQTVEAKWDTLVRPIRTIGNLAYDESRLATIAAYVDGRIENMFADYTGVPVNKNDHLARIYSPELYAAQSEYVQSKRTLKKLGPGAGQFVLNSQRELVKNARTKLVELGMTEAQIKKLESTGKPQSRLTIFTPIAGTVIKKMAAEGDYIKTGQPIYKIANLNTVWLMLELFPEDAAAIRQAQEVEAKVQSLPDEVFTGRVAFIDPVVSEKTRTVSVRVEMPNMEGKLKPGDYAEATIRVPVGVKGKVYDADLAGKWISPMHPQIIRKEPGTCPICGMDLVSTSKYGYAKEPLPQPKALVLPRNAVLHVGKNNIVYVETEPGRFEIRRVILGPILEDTVVILEGVTEGEQVATSGNFLIDSQMQLAGKPSLIDPSKAKTFGSGPLPLDHSQVAKLSGDIGVSVEKLYSSYFSIQKLLAADKQIEKGQVETLLASAKLLSDAKDFPQSLRPYLRQITQAGSHLHHMKLAESRKNFAKLSEAVIRLAARIRGEKAASEYFHFHCPMVKTSRGDWLQAEDKLANPYYGSQMLRCGNMIHHLPAQGKVHVPKDHLEHDNRNKHPKEK